MFFSTVALLLGKRLYISVCKLFSLINGFFFYENGQIYHAFVTLKCILAFHIIPCFVCPHILGLLSDLQVGVHDIQYNDLLEAVQCSRKEKPYWVGSSCGMQPMAGDQ